MFAFLFLFLLFLFLVLCSCLRSNFDSRGVNSREHFYGFLGHSSESSGVLLTKIEGNLPTSLPDLSKPKFSRLNRRKTNILDPENV